MTHLQALTRVPTGRRATALILLCCGIAAARAAGADPLASDSIEVPRVVVKYDPSSLATDRGAAELLRRLAAASRKVCPESVESRLFPTPAILQCRADALARAVGAIDSPRLSALYRANETRG
jgi:UrcA family protein